MTEWIITSCVLILVVIILRTVLKGKISLRLQYALWALVLVRLLIPGSLFSSAVSVMNAVGERPSVPTEITVADPPGRWEYPGVELAPTITQTVDEQGNVHYTEDLEKWEQDKEAAWQEYKEEHTEYVTLPVADILRTVWYAGMAVMALWLVIGNLRFRLRITRSREVIKFAPPAVYVTEDVETPCLFGLFHPSVYVTPEVAADETALSHVLAHEETHYHHKDHIWALLRCVCLVLHWYNPLVWLAAALSRRDSELACDEGAIRRLGEEQRAAYGRTLIGLTCTGVGGLLRTATTMTGSKKSIKERIVLIAKKPKMKLYTLIAVILIAVIAAGCTFTGQSMDFPGWVATITVEDLDSGSTGEGDGGASLEGPGTYRVMTIQEREELLTILQGIGKSDFVTRDPGLTEYGYSVSIHGPYNGEVRPNGWWSFTCLSDGMLKVECRDSMIAAKYGFREVQYLNCPELYSFIIEHAETYDPSTEQTDSQEEQLERLAQRMMEEHAETVTKELSHYFAPGEVQNVIPWRTGALKGSDFRLDVVKVEFYLLREEREGTGGDILRGDPVGYTRYLFLLYQGDSVTLLGHMDDTTISNVYGTPEMTDVSGDAFKVAAAELYKAYKAAQPVTPEGLLEAYARDVADAHAAELTSRSDHTVVVDRINGLTPWRSELAGGSGSHVDVVKVDYVLDHQRQGAAGPSSVISTYESVYRYLFLLYQGDSVILLGHMDDTTVSNVYGTPEMTDQYGDPFAAAAADLYNRYLLDRAFNVALLAEPNAVEAARYDLNGDGWDELIVKSGTCEADFEYVFYAYRNGVQGAEPIGRVVGGHSYLAVADDGALVVVGGHMGGEWAWRVTWDGDGFHSSLLYERDVGTGAYTNWPKRLQTVTVSGGAAVVPLPAGPVGKSGVGLTVDGENARAAAEGFFMAYARAELLSNGGVADYNVMYNELMEISTDGTAVIGRFACSVLLYDGAEIAPDNGWQARGGDYEGWYYTCPYFLLEKQADGRWLCTRWSTDDKGLNLSDFGYENGMWGAIYGNPKTYRCKETDPQKAAETLVAAYVDDLTKMDNMRCFTITDYRNLEVSVTPTLEMSEADRSVYNYNLKESEIGENHWIVEFDMEYRWTGILHAPPAGPGNGDYWMDQVHQGSPVGFLLTRDGDEFILRSRYPDRY